MLCFGLLEIAVSLSLGYVTAERFTNLASVGTNQCEGKFEMDNYPFSGVKVVLSAFSPGLHRAFTIRLLLNCTVTLY